MLWSYALPWTWLGKAWSGLVLVRNDQKINFPDTRGAGYLWLSQCTVAPTSFCVFWTPCRQQTLIWIVWPFTPGNNEDWWKQQHQWKLLCKRFFGKLYSECLFLKRQKISCLYYAHDRTCQDSSRNGEQRKLRRSSHSRRKRLELLQQRDFCLLMSLAKIFCY